MIKSMKSGLQCFHMPYSIQHCIFATLPCHSYAAALFEVLKFGRKCWHVKADTVGSI